MLAYKLQNLLQNLARKVGGNLSPGHEIRKIFPSIKIRNFRRTTSMALQAITNLAMMTLSTMTTRIMVIFCIQYKSSKTTYDLYKGQWFWPHMESIF